MKSSGASISPYHRPLRPMETTLPSAASRRRMSVILDWLRGQFTAHQGLFVAEAGRLKANALESIIHGIVSLLQKSI